MAIARRLGPVPLPAVDLRQKLKIAQILARSVGMDRMVQVDQLSSSQDLLGSQLDQVSAQIKIAGSEIVLAPFQLSNAKFHAVGSGKLSPLADPSTFVEEGATAHDELFKINLGNRRAAHEKLDAFYHWPVEGRGRRGRRRAG